jgi:PAS domain S-box-containing protein
MSATGNALPMTRPSTEAKFGALLESLPAAVILADSEGRIVLANEATERLFGYSRGELNGKTVETLVPPRLQGGAFKSSASGSALVGLRKNHSEFPAEFSQKSLHTEEGTFEVTVIRELTERKKLEQELEAKTAALESVRQELQSFTYSVSHDLRAPLRAVDGFAAMLKKSLGENISKESAHALGRVQENVSKMAKLIEGLLDYSALSWVALTARDLKPAEIAQNSFTGLSISNNGRKIKFTVGELAACKADAMLLRRLFDCLLSNALKFTRKSDMAEIHIGCRQENGETIYFVQDNGVGFDMEYSGKLFQLFQHLHSVSEFEGTGMGLAIAQRIVQRHGGKIWAQGEVDRGATFYFTLSESRYGHSA